MVKNKNAALIALGLAGLAYLFKNKQQVKNTITQVSDRASEIGSEQRERLTAEARGSSSIGDWSTDRSTTA